MTALEHVLVEGCDLEVPKMAVAMKGMEAIRSYFRESGAAKMGGRGEDDSDEEDSRDGEAASEVEGLRVEEERKGEDGGHE